MAPVLFLFLMQAVMESLQLRWDAPDSALGIQPIEFRYIRLQSRRKAKLDASVFNLIRSRRKANPLISPNRSLLTMGLSFLAATQISSLEPPTYTRTLPALVY